MSQFIKKEIIGEQSASDTSASADSDDVLYRFCGAALASMLHSRYQLIRTCPLGKKDAVSQEISLLQSVNSKEKSHIPNYLQYRDRGFMYFPGEQFLPFLRAVDRNVRQYTNPECFQQHGSQLVEVCICMCTCSVCTLYAQSLSLPPSPPPSTVYFSFLLSFWARGMEPTSHCACNHIGYVCTHIVYYMTSLLIFLCCDNYILYSIYRSHTEHYRVTKKSSPCLSLILHHAYHVIDSFQRKQLMLFIWN